MAIPLPTARAQRSEQHAEGHAVDANEENAGDDEQRLPGRPHAIDDSDQHIDQKIMGEDDQVPPHRLIDLDTERGPELLDDRSIGDEHIAAIEHQLRDELPGDEAEGDEGQEASCRRRPAARR